MLDRRGVILTGLAACAVGPSMAQDDLLGLLARGEALAIMRHALAPGVGDPADFAIGDCGTQRNLDTRGRDQARRIGERLRAEGVSFDRVLTSQWCRCRETAELLDIGPVEEAPPFNSFFAGRGDAAVQTQAALALIASLAAPPMIVSHQVNIRALTGQSTRSGEVLIARAGADRLEVLGSLLIAA